MLKALWKRAVCVTMQAWARSDTTVFLIQQEFIMLEKTNFCTTPWKKCMSLFGSEVDTKTCTTERHSHNLCTRCVRASVKTLTIKETFVMPDCTLEVRRKVGCALQWFCATTESKAGRPQTRRPFNQRVYTQICIIETAPTCFAAPSCRVAWERIIQ